MSVDKALDIDITVNQAGGGKVHVVMHDESIEGRLQLLRARGATRRGNEWFLETDDLSAFANGAEYIIQMVSDMLQPKETPGDAREEAHRRDENMCRMCGADFDAPVISASTKREDQRILDHIYPRHDARPIHKPHDPCNLVTVCGGCDDVFLQGDNFRLVSDRVEYPLTPLDVELIAWIQKRGIIRSDWAVDRVNETRKECDAITHQQVTSRLHVMAGFDLVEQLADIDQGEGFRVYALNQTHDAVVYLDQAAVHRHARLNNVELLDESVMEYITMDARNGASRRHVTV